MPKIEKLSIAVNATEEWIDDLFRRLGWSDRERAYHSRAAFLERIHDGVHRDPGVDAEEVARAVFALLAARLPAAEVEDAKAATPKELHNLWPS